MDKKIIFFFLFLIFFSKINAQTNGILEGKIIDASTHEPLEKVTIFNQTSNSGVASNVDGTFEIEIEKYPTIIIFSYVGYDNFLFEIKNPPQQPITIPLQSSNYGLPEVAITAQPKIKKLTKKSYSVKDFILDGENILILTHAGLSVGNRLILQDWKGKILSELELKSEKVNKLHRSCLGNIHLIGRKNGFEISLLENKIRLLSKYKSTEFEKWIAPCVAASSDFVYNQKYAFKNQLLAYMIVSRKENKVTALIKVIDELNLSRSKDDHALQDAMDIPLHSSQVDAWNALMYKPLFAPLLNMGKELCLFNHTYGYLEFFSFEGKTKRFIPITYHQEKKWNKEILLDKSNNNVFTIFKTKKGKAIYQINLEDGTIRPALFIDCLFVEKMTIHRGHLFYLESGVTNDLRNRVLHRVKVQ